MSANLKFPLEGKRVWVAGHAGMVGRALTRQLQAREVEIVTAQRSDLDLSVQADVRDWMNEVRPDAIFLAAAKVGGIVANRDKSGEFLYENMMIAANVIESARQVGVTKVLFLGSSCIYPKYAEQPIREEALLSGALEETNEAYAVAKIAGLKLALHYRRQYGCDFISAMPTNLYGPNDNFDLQTSHVLPALIRKAHEAKVSNAAVLSIWGSGTPRREFLHVDDCARALIFLMEMYSDDLHINVGSGHDVEIQDVANIISNVVGFRGSLTFDRSKPDGTPRKLMDSTKLRTMGWEPLIDLNDGIAETYRWFLRSVT